MNSQPGLPAANWTAGSLWNPAIPSVLQGEPGHIEIESLKGAEATLYLKSMLYGYIDHVAAIGRAAGGEDCF